uniref:Secreted protein n=1 Tax=Thraustotheca clavata TaxID=74557 RepID=A0A0A7CLK9_9STRA|nr:secreted protein [Thraustotheca clavata]
MKFFALLSFIATLATATNEHHLKACQYDMDCNSNSRCHRGNNYALCLPRAVIRRMFVCADKSTFYGDDINMMQSTYQDCMDRCQSNDECNAFTWMPAVDNTRDGECRLKHLMDLTRQATPLDHTMQACRAVNWVLQPMHHLQGSVLAKLADIMSLDLCLDSCINNSQQCVGVNYDMNDRTCVLYKKAIGYSRSNTMVGTVIAAIRHGYRICIANGDIQVGNDTINFVGSFQDCNKCVSNHKMNAFMWMMSGENMGTCHCKNMTLTSKMMVGSSHKILYFV